MMDDLRENSVLNSVDREEIHEPSEHYTCVANKCMSVRWLKPKNVRELKFVSEDVLLIHVGKMLLFYNVKTQKENILIVSGNKIVPSVDDGNLNILPLDGVACVGCCGIDLLALAEQPPISKVIVCRYPDFKVLVTFIDDSNPYSAGVKSMSFVKTEYLIGLRDYPAHDLIVWSWRIGEKLFTVKTGYIQPDQSLSVFDDGHDVLLSVAERSVTARLQLWRVFVGGRTVHALRTPVDLPRGVDMAHGTCCWVTGKTGHGWFVFCDTSANVYRTRPTTVIASTAEMCVEYAGSDGGGTAPRRALLCRSSQGFVLHVSGRLTGFNEVKGAFVKSWTIILNYMLQSVVLAGDNDFYGWSDEGILLKCMKNTKLNTITILQYYGNNIKYFVFVKPTDLLVVTINEKNVLQVWDVSTGKFRCEMELNGIATNVCSNPRYYYVAVSFKNGKVELLKTDPNESDVELISKMVLCDEELSCVNFFSDGKECLATNFSTGRLYHIRIELEKTCSIIKEYHLKKEIIDAKIFDDKQSSLLTILYREHEEISEVAGNNVVIFNKNFDIVFKLLNTQHNYTSIFKWISFDIPGTINIALTVLKSFHIHLMTINIVEEKVLRSKIIPLDHDVRVIKISSWKKHCITFCNDGTYNVYEFTDDDQWKKIIRVNCSHWQTGGLMAAEIDSSYRNILTLSREGNLMCTSFKDSCHHIRRNYQIDSPIIIKIMKTKGIGFENEAGSPKRITWTMIKQTNEWNAQIEKKKQLSEEFEKIKKNLLALYEENQNGPEDERLDKEEFYIDDDEYRLWFDQNYGVERDEYEARMISDTNICKMKKENIIKEHWDPLIAKPKSIHCIKDLYKVNNYSISKEDQEIINKSTRIINKRSLSNLLSFEEKYKGSISHELIETIECLYSQYDYYKLDIAEDEMILLEFIISKLKLKFNSLFDDLFVDKQQILDKLNGFNNRLRVIEIELRLACKIESTAPSPVEYKWSQYEQTERLLYVEDNKVAMKFNNLLLNEKKSTHSNEDNNEQSQKVEKFRKQALIHMMDGVLQKIWEDELKKDIPKPHCMLNKKPEDYTVGDLKLIIKYEEAVVALNNDRMKYKTILEQEKIEIDRNIKKSIKELDKNIKNLFEIKIKYDSAINQEYLKIIRISKILNDSDQRKQQIKLLERNCLENENTLTELKKKITKIQENIYDVNTILSTLMNTDRELRNKFESKFHKTTLIAYNLRPKMLGNTNYSSLVGYQFVDTIMDPTYDKLDLLSSPFIKYLNTLKMNDDYKYVTNKKLRMNSKTWQRLCYYRRLKIKNEFKIINCQKDLINETNFLKNLKQHVKNHTVMMKMLKTSITQLKNQDFRYKDELEVQLIVKKGNTEEIKLTGHIEDFDDVLLIHKNVCLERKNEVEKQKSIKASEHSHLFEMKRKCQIIKSDINIQKLKIILYKYRCEFIKHMTLTKNILDYQELKAKGMVKNAEQKVKERAEIEFAYNKQKTNLKERQIKLTEEIKKFTKENKKLDETISAERKKMHHISNQGIIKEIGCARKIEDIEHSAMITKIQTLCEDIVVLETQLESLQLKVFSESQS